MNRRNRIEGIIAARKSHEFSTLSIQKRAPVFALVCLLIASSAGAKSLQVVVSGNAPSSSRRAQLVEANIIAVHAYQIILARQSNTGSAECYPRTSPDTATLQQLVKHQQSLLAEPTAQVNDWANGKQTSFDPAKDLYPLLHAKLSLPANLPVNVFTRYLKAAAPTQPEENIRSIANLYQTVLEVERDGTLLQELYRFYIGLHLPVYVGQLGLPGSDADFLAAGQQLAGKSCTAPFGLTAPEWQIAGRKIWNWGEKNLHIRDANTIARELLAEPQTASLIPAMKAVKPEKIAIIGHSFTMDEHWSSPSSFVPIVTAMFAQENPRVQFKQWFAGGLTYSRAYRNFYSDAHAWKPNIVLLVLANRTPADIEALKTMAAGFKASGARVLMFDDVEVGGWDKTLVRQADAAAKQAGVEIIPSQAILDAAPNHASFPCMDGIHKREPYHRLMAVLWLKAILRTSSQPSE